MLEQVGEHWKEEESATILGHETYFSASEIL